MDERAELIALRRLAELEAKAAGTSAPAAAPGYLDTVKANMRSTGEGARDTAAGLVRGAGSIGATFARLFESKAENEIRRRVMDEALGEMGADTDSFAYGGGKLGAEVAGTLGMGGGLARVAGMVPGVAAAAPGFLNSLASSGMAAGARAPGALGFTTNALTRAGGGGLAGGAAAGLASPGDAGIGAGFGAVLPGGFQAAGAVGRFAAGARRSPEQAAALAIAQRMGANSPEEIMALRGRLGAAGPQIIPGDMATVPQLAQNMDISQLARTVHNAGGQQVAEREALNNLARLEALNRISPVSGTLQQSAEDFGNTLQSYGRPAEAAAGRNVNALYEAIDPFAETRFLLPQAEMEAARAKYLGPGTFGSGKAADAAINAAREIGTTELPADAVAKAGKGVSLLDAVKRAGGINENTVSSKGLAGEVRGLRQAGIGRAVYKDRGLSVEKMAERMHEAGYLADEDPDTLINMLQDAGRTTFAGDRDAAYRAQAMAAGGGPRAAETIAKPVAFQELQSLRSSIGEAASEAGIAGRKREAAALNQMKADIDARVNAVAAGEGDAAEYFPADIVKSWRDANKAHADKMARFHTGPQRAMFRKGSDGQPLAEGAQLAGKFVNSSRSQVEDAQALLRLNGPGGPLLAPARNYLATDAAGQTNALGTLSNAKFGNWLDARSGVTRELLGPADNALLQGIGRNLGRADSANRLGMATGSNSLQNAQSALSLGLLGSPITQALADRIPGVRMLTGPALRALQEAAKKSKAKTFGELLASPQALDEALATIPQGDRELRLLLVSARAALGTVASRGTAAASNQE